MKCIQRIFGLNHMHVESGKYIIGAGLLLTVAGIIWYYFGDKLGFLGNLPGDIKIEKESL